MADTFNQISVISFVLAALFFLLSAFMFFKFNIRKIVGDLSGRNARKSIDAMKQEKVNQQQVVANTMYNMQIKKQSAENQKLVQSNATEPLEENSTVLLNNDDNVTTILADDNNTTTLLAHDNNPMIASLDNSIECIVLSETMGTTILGQDEVGTTILSNAQLMPKEQQFIVTKEITFIHGAVTL